LIKDYGDAHARSVLIAIAETGNNSTQLVRPVILAASDVLRTHARWADSGSALLAALDRIDLGKLRAIVKASKVLHTREAIAVLLCAELERYLGPPVLPKPARVKREPKPFSPVDAAPSNRAAHSPRSRAARAEGKDAR
jgi:hypothetical protein